MKFNLDALEKEFIELEAKLMDPEIFKDQKQVKEVATRKKQIDEAVTLYREYRDLHKSIEENKTLMWEEKDEEMKEFFRTELEESESRVIELEEALKVALLPKDPNDDKNIMVELRAGAGGDEAALFAGELARSYVMFAEAQGFKVEITEKSESESGGVKEMIFEVRGEGAYSWFKYESGVHRVQRIPETESKGRVHTSTITVAIMPEVEEFDIEIKDEDLEIKATKSSGAGGQHVNTTDSAIHMVHIPTGIAVFCQDGRSQHKNKEKAYQIMRAKLYALEEEKRQKELGEARLAQVGSGDRSEKIRTYNFPQDRVTDHRIGENFSGIPQIMSGRLEAIIEACALADQQMKLEQAGKSE
ncbi:peptide chain release factor 1 [Candidatus Gracilibacteria bacterium]|nr:peptide chain release factor 1 [Candidatus Gracilibacteria bacterium]